MLSIDEARAIVLGATRPLPPESVALADALDRVLAVPVSAAVDVPRFVNSAMDGFPRAWRLLDHAVSLGPTDEASDAVKQARERLARLKIGRDFPGGTWGRPS